MVKHRINFKSSQWSKKRWYPLMLETGDGLTPHGHMLATPRGRLLNRCMSVPASEIGIHGATQNMLRYRTHELVDGRMICRFIGQSHAVQMRSPHFRHLFVVFDGAKRRYRFKFLACGHASRSVRARIRLALATHVSEYFKTRDLAKVMSKWSTVNDFRAHVKRLSFKRVKSVIVEYVKLLE